MKSSLKIMNSKEVKEFVKELEKCFDCDINSLKRDYYFFLSKTRGRYYLLKKSNLIREIPDSLKINRVGCYFATKEDDGIRLSIEGSQIICNQAKKNILEIKPENMKKWLTGDSIEIDEQLSVQIKEKVDPEKNRFVIIKCGEDFLGCGKVTKEKILNFVPKERRVHSSFE